MFSQLLVSRDLVTSHLLRVDALGHGPGGDDVVHHPLAQARGHLVELQEVPDVVEHLVVAVGVGVHLLEDGGHVSKDGGVEQSYRERRGGGGIKYNHSLGSKVCVSHTHTADADALENLVQNHYIKIRSSKPQNYLK